MDFRVAELAFGIDIASAIHARTQFICSSASATLFIGNASTRNWRCNDARALPGQEAVDQEAEVHAAGDVAVDRRVDAAEHLDPLAGDFEDVARARNLGIDEQRVGVGCAEEPNGVRVDVVGMLVGEQHRVQVGEAVEVGGQRAGVDQPAPARVSTRRQAWP